jgi:hypothetical protein
MTRKTYETLQEELRQAQQYIWTLIHDDIYGVVNARAYPHEYARIKHAARHLAVVQVPDDHNPNVVKRAVHVRHPGVILIALPIKNNFVCILAHDPESWCMRVKATLHKYNQVCTTAYVPTTGNPAIDFITCLELIQLTTPTGAVDYLKEAAL